MMNKNEKRLRDEKESAMHEEFGPELGDYNFMKPYEGSIERKAECERKKK
ncbi:hypothetical protein [Priestia filamentosa]|nr:hypothetical protein [Priestia filamentosa]